LAEVVSAIHRVMSADSAGKSASSGMSADSAGKSASSGMSADSAGESASSGIGLGDIDPGARLDQDLQLESVDLVTLDALLRQRYGAGVDLLGFVAGLDIDEMIGLTVSDVVRHVEAVTS